MSMSTDSVNERTSLGRAVYARNFRLLDTQAEALMRDAAGQMFVDEAYLVAGGPGWQSRDLTDRDRSVAVIAALVGQHVTDERLHPYLSLARRNGVTEEGLEALMVLLAAYVGQPAASRGARTVQATRSDPEPETDEPHQHPGPPMPPRRSRRRGSLY
jgi:4-carboxymuconolactone decarboxylase